MVSEQNILSSIPISLYIPCKMLKITCVEPQVLHFSFCDFDKKWGMKWRQTLSLPHGSENGPREKWIMCAWLLLSKRSFLSGKKSWTNEDEHGSEKGPHEKWKNIFLVLVFSFMFCSQKQFSNCFLTQTVNKLKKYYKNATNFPTKMHPKTKTRYVVIR